MGRRRRGLSPDDLMLIGFADQEPSSPTSPHVLMVRSRPHLRVFEKIARERQAPLTQSVLFDSKAHFEGCHDDEVLFRIGPFATVATKHIARAKEAQSEETAT